MVEFSDIPVVEDRPNHLISYPFPLEGGEMVGNIRLPKYLTQEDADRVKAFVQTLVMENNETV